jgi:hypothetical protein
MPDSLTVKQASSGLIGKSGFGAIHTPLIGKMSATAEELKSRPTKPINRAPSANRLWIPTLEVLMSNLVNSQEGQYQIKVFQSAGPEHAQVQAALILGCWRIK